MEDDRGKLDKKKIEKDGTGPLHGWLAFGEFAQKVMNGSRGPKSERRYSID